ncbi:hypothetical protein [Vibrio phage TCU-VP03-AIR1]|uniref:Uncharacterized protein n=1 Tax=Vibrio phage phi-pp2 TaxID=1204514 RepID=I6WI24_9CAUD|nr:hypothetical protein pp2_300 [Vibrio phage phi-pp2]
MINHNELKQQIHAREAEEKRILIEHYTSECEKEFMHAVESGSSFPIIVKVPIHAADKDKRGATIIRTFFEEHGYRSLRTSYETGGRVLVEIHENGTNLTRMNFR